MPLPPLHMKYVRDSVRDTTAAELPDCRCHIFLLFLRQFHKNHSSFYHLMKKVLVIAYTASSGGGSEKVLNTMIESLSDVYRFDVLEIMADSALPFSPPGDNVRYLGALTYSDRLAAARGKNILLNKARHLFFVMMNSFFPRLVHRMFVKEKYDYEISFNYLYSSALVAHSPDRDSKKVMWIHGSIENLTDPLKGLEPVERLYRHIQHKAFRKADAIVPISRRTRDSIVRFHPSAEKMIHVINNGYDFDSIRHLAMQERIEKSGCFRIISVGRLSKAKNVMMQARIMEILRQRGIRAELILLGEGEEKDQLEEYARRNGNITLTGFRKNPYPYILSADALLITSLAEGFPTVAVEAMALGKPVITTPVAGTDELISGDTGILVNWDDEDAADGIIKAMERKWDPEKIKDSVMKYSKENWAGNIKKLLTATDNGQTI